jgi:aspartokinase
VPASTRRIRIGGLKLSGELVGLRLFKGSDPEVSIEHLPEVLSKNRVNMPFLTVTGNEHRSRITCCVDAENENQIRKIIHNEPLLRDQVEVLTGVGSLSLFPHKFDLRMVGLCFSALAKAEIPIHGMASSLSSLTFVVDFALLGKAVNALTEFLEFPPDHAPFEPVIHVTQSPEQKRNGN